METREEIRTVQEMITELLENDVRCRNDDKWLTYQVMRRFTKIYIPFEDFQRIPAFETIKRVRAKIQNKEKRFLPTDPKVLVKRGHRQEVFREEMLR